MTAYRFTRSLGVTLLAVVTVSQRAGAETVPACSTVSEGAQAALLRSVENLRRAHGAHLRDWQGQTVQLRGNAVCVNAVLADFDGSGSEDVVALYRVGEEADRILLSAFHLGEEWRASVVEIVPGAKALALLPPGEYTRNPALTRRLRPAEKGVVTSSRPGVAISLRPTACLAFFLGDHGWVFTERTCQ